jgi:hypothetical protein
MPSAPSAVHASPGAGPSPSAVHDLCATSFGRWAGYRDVFLSAEVQDVTIRSGLSSAASPAEASDGAADDKARSLKKRKIDDQKPALLPSLTRFSWTVCCMDGATFSVALPEDTPVAEAKCAIGMVRDVPQYARESFVEGQEEPLDDKKRLG